MKSTASDKTKSNFALLFSTQRLLSLSNKFVSMSVINMHFLLQIVLFNKKN